MTVKTSVLALALGIGLVACSGASDRTLEVGRLGTSEEGLTAAPTISPGMPATSRALYHGGTVVTNVQVVQVLWGAGRLPASSARGVPAQAALRSERIPRFVRRSREFEKRACGLAVHRGGLGVYRRCLAVDSDAA